MQWWFTSDEHNGHYNAMTGWAGMKGSSKPRPWSTLENMTEGLIERHNSVVKPGDIVYHLGDAFWRTFGTVQSAEYVMRLNGQHFYILGNHEEVFEKDSLGSLHRQFVWVRDYAKIRPRKDLPSIVLSHYAHRVWDGSHKDTLHLYGHSHGAIPDFGRSMDVGVDCNDFYPVSLDQVVEKLKDRITELPFTPRD